MNERGEEPKIPDVKPSTPEYPNWRKGILLGLLVAVPVFALSYFAVPKSDLELAGTFAIIAYLGVGGLAAFRPPR